MKKSLINKIYIHLYMKYCRITHKKFLKRYIAVYKYGNKIGFFTDAIGINKNDCIEKVRTIAYHSGFFDGIKNKKNIQVIVIENEVS